MRNIVIFILIVTLLIFLYSMDKKCTENYEQPLDGTIVGISPSAVLNDTQMTKLITDVTNNIKPDIQADVANLDKLEEQLNNIPNTLSTNSQFITAVKTEVSDDLKNDADFKEKLNERDIKGSELVMEDSGQTATMDITTLNRLKDGDFFNIKIKDKVPITDTTPINLVKKNKGDKTLLHITGDFNESTGEISYGNNDRLLSNRGIFNNIHACDINADNTLDTCLNQNLARGEIRADKYSFPSGKNITEKQDGTISFNDARKVDIGKKLITDKIQLGNSKSISYDEISKGDVDMTDVEEPDLTKYNDLFNDQDIAPGYVFEEPIFLKKNVGGRDKFYPLMSGTRGPKGEKGDPGETNIDGIMTVDNNKAILQKNLFCFNNNLCFNSYDIAYSKYLNFVDTITSNKANRFNLNLKDKLLLWVYGNPIDIEFDTNNIRQFFIDNSRTPAKEKAEQYGKFENSNNEWHQFSTKSLVFKKTELSDLLFKQSRRICVVALLKNTTIELFNKNTDTVNITTSENGVNEGIIKIFDEPSGLTTQTTTYEWRKQYKDGTEWDIDASIENLDTNDPLFPRPINNLENIKIRKDNNNDPKFDVMFFDASNLSINNENINFEEFINFFKQFLDIINFLKNNAL